MQKHHTISQQHCTPLTDRPSGHVAEGEGLVVGPAGLARDQARAAQVLHPDAVGLADDGVQHVAGLAWCDGCG